MSSLHVIRAFDVSGVALDIFLCWSECKIRDIDSAADDLTSKLQFELPIPPANMRVSVQPCAGKRDSARGKRVDAGHARTMGCGATGPSLARKWQQSARSFQLSSHWSPPGR
jgi:hypothetical protein